MREEILNQKLMSLQSFIDQAKQTSENGWLVCRIFYLVKNYLKSLNF